MPLARGTKFAGYRVIRLLGSGGMGQVYLAEHPRLPRRDALKVLPADISADPEYRERFIREADLAARLWHPNIVGLHDRGEYDGQSGGHQVAVPTALVLLGTCNPVVRVVVAASAAPMAWGAEGADGERWSHFPHTAGCVIITVPRTATPVVQRSRNG